MDPEIDPKVFVERAEAFAKDADIELTTLAQKISADRRLFQRLKAGRVTYRTVRAASKKLEELEKAKARSKPEPAEATGPPPG